MLKSSVWIVGDGGDVSEWLARRLDGVWRGWVESLGPTARYNQLVLGSKGSDDHASSQAVIEGNL